MSDREVWQSGSEIERERKIDERGAENIKDSEMTQRERTYRDREVADIYWK
jgi:hypothetical protein